MRICKKKLSVKVLAMMIAVLFLIGALPVTVFADGASLLTLEELRAQNGAISIEAYNIGQGFLVEPTLYAKEDGKSAGDITLELLSDLGLAYEGNSSYFSGFEFDDSVEPDYPAYLQDYLEDGCVYEENDAPDGYLGEYDYSEYAGWCFTINDWWASLGVDSACPGEEISDYNTGEEIVLGDVIRWHFTVYGFGIDCGFANNAMAEWMGGNLFIQEDKSDLLFMLAAIHDYYGNLAEDTVYETALAVAADPLATTQEITAQEAILTAYVQNTFLGGGDTPEVIYGDANNDGEVNSSDLVIFTTALLSNEAVSDAFDFNGDGVFNILDFIRLKKTIAKMVG